MGGQGFFISIVFAQIRLCYQRRGSQNELQCFQLRQYKQKKSFKCFQNLPVFTLMTSDGVENGIQSIESFSHPRHAKNLLLALHSTAFSHCRHIYHNMQISECCPTPDRSDSASSLSKALSHSRTSKDDFRKYKLFGTFNLSQRLFQYSEAYGQMP